MGRQKPNRKPKGKGKERQRRRRRTLTPKPTVKRVDEDELKALIEHARDRPLSEGECAELRGVVETLAFVVRELDEKNLSLRRLRSLFGLASSEKLSNVLPADEAEGATDETTSESEDTTTGGEDAAGQEAEEKPPAKGHGRNGADAYTGAERVKVPHECLGPGDDCPSCGRGKVYEQRHRPRVLVRVEGQAPLKATVYELQTFRCNLCGELFVAKPPDGVGDEKYDSSSRAMIGLLKYGSGLPFNRLEGLEGHLGVPLPASTQWDLVKEAAGDLGPAYEELIRVAAQGELLHNDDTSMRVLSLMKENTALRQSGAAKSGARTGIFVTGILSVAAGRRVALFFTGRKHAGENLQDVLNERSSELPAPLQMSDALDRNDPAEAETRRGSCLTHGRRKFVEIVESFPVECKHVLDVIAEVYKHDAECRAGDLSAEARLAYHVERSKPLLDELKAWFDHQLKAQLVEPNSSLGGAINYMLNHWGALTLFLREPGAPLDNNACERQLKKAILHRKNSLFYKTLNGARVGDLFMSLIYTTELAGGNPQDYLTALLDHPDDVASDPAAWLPWSYQETLAALGA